MRLLQTRGNGAVEVGDIALEMDGLRYDVTSRTLADDGSICYHFDVPDSATGNNSCRLTANIKRAPGSMSHGKVMIVTKQ